MLKRTIWFLILAVLFLFIIEPNWNGLQRPEPLVPPESLSLVTNENVLDEKASSQSTILLEIPQDPQQQQLLAPLLEKTASDLQEAGYTVLSEGNADLQLSLVLSEADPAYGGYSLFSSPQKLAIDLSEEIALLLQQIHFSTYLGVDSDHYENFPQLMAQDIPSILIQIGYITNEQDVAKIENSEIQAAIAQAITAGLLHVLN